MQKIIKVTKRIKRIWASRFAPLCAPLVRRALASGYALRGWCASRLLRSRGRSITFAAVGGYGGSATMRFAEGSAFPLAKSIIFPNYLAINKSY
jgi:hypothetical protein